MTPDARRTRLNAVPFAIVALSLSLAACGGANEEEKAKAAALSAAQPQKAAAAASTPSAGDPLAETTTGPSAVTESALKGAALSPNAIIDSTGTQSPTAGGVSPTPAAAPPKTKALGLSSTCTVNQVKTFGNYCSAPAVGVIGNASSKTFVNTKAGYNGSITASCFLGFVSWTGSTCDPVVAAAPNPAPAPVVAPAPVAVVAPAPVAVVAPAPVAVVAPAPAPAPAVPTASAVQAAASAGLDALVPTPLLSSAAAMKTLSYVTPNPTATASGIGPVGDCKLGYTPPASIIKTSALPLPSNGGVFYTPSELATWKKRVTTGPFIKANDYTQGSPGDWTRIVENAKLFASKGEASTPGDAFATHGTLARDAAFHELITGEGTKLEALRKFLLAQTSNPAVDFPKSLCITDKTGSTADAWFFQATWLMRYVVTYDYIRPSLNAADRLAIENFIRRNAYFMSAHIDWGIGDNLFPARKQGDYSVRRGNASATDDAGTWWSKRYDTNGDCKVDSSDPAKPAAVYAYTKADGSLGPRITVLSQYFNNRKSLAAGAYGAAGVLLGDPDLIGSAKRYFMEWLTYSVWPDGSQGEYARNGDYCIAPQGVIYGSINIQAAGLLARVLTRQGDNSLATFSTTEGLFGSQSGTGGTAKSIAQTIDTHLKLLNGQLGWYFHNAAISKQSITPTNSLGNNVVRFMNGTQAADDFHELGMLQAAAMFPTVPIAGMVLREKATTSLRFPGSTGNPVPTGNGTWTDVFNALPAAFLIRP